MISKGDPTDLFVFKISYNEVENDLNNMITPLYNGNISETFWKTDSDNIKRNYGYQYDNLNRLTNSIYQKDNVPTNSYNEVISYDKNGNITTTYRTGYQDGSDQSAPFEIDDLVYGYNTDSNRLQSVYDQSAKLDGFKDGNPNGIDYDYDANGNMITDRNKGIVTNGIKYNHLNLPTSITFENGSTITYLYNAVGKKLGKTVTSVSPESGAQTTKTDYLNGFQYLTPPSGAGGLSLFPTAEGYVSVVNGQSFNYVYNYTDHLGNNRVSYTQSGSELKILEENHYYPFGLKHSNYNTDVAKYKNGPDGISVVVTSTERSDYQYKYNGKEFQDELGLNWHDYHARNYMADIGRTTTYDPLAEKFYHLSPQSFLNNNPIYFIDPTGMEVISGNFGTTFYGADAAAAFQSIKDQLGSWDDSSSERNPTDRDGEEDKEDDGDPPMKDKGDKKITPIGPDTPFFNIDGSINSEAYNCHSHAWSNKNGDPGDPANSINVKDGFWRWDNDPQNNKEGYYAIPFSASNQVGDRVIYYAWNADIGRSEATHSAIVTRINSEGQAIEVTSKPGTGGLQTHHPRNIPSSYGSPNPTYVAPNGKTYQSRVYYRKL